MTEPTMNTKQRFDAILLLGTELEANNQPTKQLRIRAAAAAEAYREQGCRVPVIPCGGYTKGSTRTEAEVMRDLLIKAGVPETDIVLENESKTTVENFANAIKLLGGAAGKHVLVVTSDFHVRRSVLIARRMGLRAKGYPAILEHDDIWKHKRFMEIRHTICLLLGWMDEGKTTPKWAKAILDMIFKP